MTKFATIVLVSGLFVATACTKDAVEPACSTVATVRDLSGLDGCGFVFELADGTRLEPVRMMYCGTAPFTAPTDDPLYNYVFVDGRKVKIDYELTGGASACMVGPSVRITCLTEERRNDL